MTTDDRSKHPPSAGPNLDSAKGLQELRRLLLPLAMAYEEARIEEAHAWQRFQDQRLVDPGPPPHALAEYRAAVESRDVSIKARRALADGVVRMMVRGHAVDCACLICTLERKMLETLTPTPRTALSKRQAPAKRATRSKVRKGGGHV